MSIGKPPGNACLTQQIVRDFYGSKPVREYIVMQFKFYLNFLISSYYYYSVGLILIFCAHLLSILSRRHIGYMFLITKRIINLIEIRIFCYNQANDRIAMMCACMHVWWHKNQGKSHIMPDRPYINHNNIILYIFIIWTIMTSFACNERHLTMMAYMDIIIICEFLENEIWNTKARAHTHTHV